MANSDERYDPDTNNHIILLKLIKDEARCCPHCGLVGGSSLRSSVIQDIKHASAIENNILIKLYRRIYICECGKTFREVNPFTSSKRKLSLQKEIKILNALKDINKSFKDVAEEFQVSITTVINLFDSKVDIKRQTLIEVICVDEVYAKHVAYHKYCFIVYSPQKNEIIDVLDSRNKEELISYFSRIPEEERKLVKYFSMDLYIIYKQVAELCFPNAKISADHFHVMKNLGDNFNAARIRIMKQYEHLLHQKENWYWLYKKYWKLLLRNPEKLRHVKFKVSKSGMYLSEHEIVENILKLDKDLAAGYELLNEYKNFNSVAKSDNAAAMLDDLIVKFHNSPLKEFYKSYKLLKNWRQEIINSFDTINGHVISNGGMERANRDIKTIIRHAYGFKNFARLRNRIMYVKNENAAILGYRKTKKK